VVRRQCLEEWRTNSWSLLHDNAPVQWSDLVKDFLAKNNVTILQHPPYFPELALADFYLFPQWYFSDATDIKKNVMEGLKGFHKMASKNASDIFTVTGKSVQLHKGTTFKEM
jgi:hypothetical protein